MQTSNFNAEAPRGPIVINAISKAGGADYHGGGYFYIRNDVFNANDWQSDAAGTSKEQCSLLLSWEVISAVQFHSLTRSCFSGEDTRKSFRTPATPTALTSIHSHGRI